MKKELVILVSHLLGFVLLMQGLFPFSSTSTEFSTHSCFEHQNSSSRHVIVMIIDALRADYVLSRNSSFTLRSIRELEEEGRAISFELRTHTPTVTLPRLKALLTGTVPSFWDVLFNYNSSRLELDNLLFQYRRSHPAKKIVFYGDDTWLKLFPEQIFARSESLQSFFVQDYHEIDLNVTRSVQRELKAMDDWDLLIVHYLGLDHIGHAFGALNELVREKLKEMDDVIRQLSSSLRGDDLLLITGDHGMIDQGGHGGASKMETDVPAVFISPHFQSTLDVSPSIDHAETFFQIDLTPTLSALMEISIPWNNLGIGLDPLFRRFFAKDKDQLRRCLNDDNRRQLFTLLASKGLSPSSEHLTDLRRQALALANEQDGTFLLLSLILFLSSCSLHWLLIDGLSIVSLISSMIVGWIFSLLLNNSLLGLSVGLILFNILLFVTQRRTSAKWNFVFDGRRSSLFLHFYPLFHLVSLFSSSFIEEEHQTWSYFLSTAIVLLVVEEKSPRLLFILVGLRFVRHWNQTGNKWLNSPDLADWINRDEHRLFLFLLHSISTVGFLLLLNRSTKSRAMKMTFPMLVWIFRWNLLGSWSSFVPLFGYLLLLIPRWSMDEFFFSLLFLLCRSHQSVLLLLHWLFYRFGDVHQSPLAFLFSQAAFFHLGNSNSFVTINISTGFVGIPFYLPVLHGFFIWFSTYGLSLIWLFRPSREERRKSLVHQSLINVIFVLCVSLQRYHLFVWTVFAPKLFYLFAQTLTFLLLSFPFE